MEVLSIFLKKDLNFPIMVINFAVVKRKVHMETTVISKERIAYLERARQLQEAIDRGEKISLMERSKRLGPIMSLVPGFSFDSDSKVKLYM